jgi:hypothetical protein
VDQPVDGVKAESVMSMANADHDPGHGNADVVVEPAQDHQSTKSGSVKDVGAEEPKARSESAKSVAEDHESMKSRGKRDAGVEEPKATSESAKSVAEDHESTKAEGVADTGVEEPKARSESAKSVAEDAARVEVESVRSREGAATTETEHKGEGESKSPKEG